MRGLFLCLYVVVAVGTSSEVQAQTVPFACGTPGPAATDGNAKFITWNIQELAVDKPIYDRPVRTPEEFAVLREYRQCLQGDVYALQEVASPKAVAQVFPTDSYDICFSGQKNAAARKKKDTDYALTPA